jgi:DNA-directed RNA polymerase sigma subunit (sigma70/sigma32)
MNLADDTELDSIAAQARSWAALSLDDVALLLADVRERGDGQARERLVEHHLGIALDEALARGDRGIELADLYQEGTLATLVAVAEFAERAGRPTGLAAYVARVVGTHLEHVIEAAELERRSSEAFVRDAELYEVAEVALRQKLERPATTTELAAILEWPEERVVIVGDMLNAARKLADADLTQYLDEA